MSQRLVINKMEGAKRKRKMGAFLNNVIFTESQPEELVGKRKIGKGTGGVEEMVGGSEDMDA